MIGLPVIGLDEFARALALGKRSLVALVGGGGKTTLLFALGGQLPGRTLLTTTTRMGSDRSGGFSTLIGPTPEDLTEAFVEHDCLLAWKSIDGHKALGFAPVTVDAWAAAGLADHIVVEADGARRLPFTAPAPWEPPIPSGASHVVACMGSDALGYVIADALHRPLRVAAAAGCSPYERLTPARAAAALTSPVGMRKNVTADARFVVAVTKVDPEDEQVAALAGELDQRGVATILIGWDRETGPGPYQDLPYQDPLYQDLPYQDPLYQNLPYQDLPYQDPSYQDGS